MMDEKNFLDQLVKSDIRTYNNIRKIATDEEDDFTTSCLIDYAYFRNYYRLIAIDLRKQEALQADPKTVQQINYTLNLDRAGNATLFFIIEEAKETVLDFSQGTVRVL